IHTMNEFTLEEVVPLLYRHAVLIKNLDTTEKISDVNQIGHVCGLLTMNDQIEVVIKFYDELRQFTKKEFESEVRLLET
ncbi:MAG: hypothetical protein ABL925_19415, partial [Methylococcales bacterium]